MADHSHIEWTDTTWNPVTGCTKVSPGCDHCYAQRIVERFHGKGAFNIVVRNETRLHAPLHWRRPRRVFVNSMSDLFHDQVPDRFIADVFAVMATAHRHTFQILTKRHARLRSLLGSASFWATVNAACIVRGYPPIPAGTDHLPNTWIGISVENQRWADLRIPALLHTPAAVRFLSCEPLLGPIDLAHWLKRPQRACHRCHIPGPIDYDSAHLWGTCPCACHPTPPTRPDWVIVGGESGPAARPLDLAWLRHLTGQCRAAKVAVFVKQLGTAWARNQHLHHLDPKGGNPDHWPADLHVRDYPKPVGHD